uniref:Methyltransferase n=1 Tax=viral metagenome TaxID=1070528 RepID=A0A6M3J7T1_9ZZZZ
MMKKIIGKNFNWADPRHPVEEISLEIKNIPAYMGCVDFTYKRRDDYVADILFGVCPYTGTIQSMNRLPQDRVYLKPHNVCIGDVWETHNSLFAKFVISRIPDNAVIYEIGGGDGNIASRCIDYVKEWHCIEPNTPNNYFEHPKLIYHNNRYLDKNDIQNADIVVHSHVLEHMRSPIEFLISIDTPQIFSIPNFDEGMRIGNPSMLNFEHETALNANVLEDLVDRSGYSITSSEYSNFSLFYEIQKTDRLVDIRSYTFDYNRSLDILLSYRSSLVIQAIIIGNNVKRNRKKYGLVFFFGAHIFYTILQSCGMNTEFDGIIDNSTIKIGKRLYGTDHIVNNPNIIKDFDKVMVVVPSVPYRSEMIAQIKSLNPKAYIVTL